MTKLSFLPIALMAPPISEKRMKTKEIPLRVIHTHRYVRRSPEETRNHCIESLIQANDSSYWWVIINNYLPRHFQSAPQ